LFRISYNNGCCLDYLSEFTITLHHIDGNYEVYNQLIAHFDVDNDRIIIRLDDEDYFQIPYVYTFKIHIQAYNRQNFDLADIDN